YIWKKTVQNVFDFCILTLSRCLFPLMNVEINNDSPIFLSLVFIRLLIDVLSWCMSLITSLIHRFHLIGSRH
ncbi:hypothetical protein, partial [Enterococcus gallinarum]|uniref:hypothetical protein n=1 Tax=Enterococcus gallinarum TaxID=1353 RepID=UPI003D6C2E66